MSLKIYNTLTRKIDELIPGGIKKNKRKITLQSQSTPADLPFTATRILVISGHLSPTIF